MISVRLIAFKRNGSVDFTTEISNCVHKIEEWSEVNGLKLSSTKTGSLHVSSRHRLSNLILTQNVYGIHVHATKTKRGLGVTLDKFMFKNFVSQKCCSPSFGCRK